jgi:hypothetical protein
MNEPEKPGWKTTETFSVWSLVGLISGYGLPDPSEWVRMASVLCIGALGVVLVKSRTSIKAAQVSS